MSLSLLDREVRTRQLVFCSYLLKDGLALTEF